jgi:hypothetical protein
MSAARSALKQSQSETGVACQSQSVGQRCAERHREDESVWGNKAECRVKNQAFQIYEIGGYPDCRSLPCSPASVGGGAPPLSPGGSPTESLDEGPPEAPTV